MSETIGRSDCRPIVRLSADTIVRWDYRPNPNYNYDFSIKTHPTVIISLSDTRDVMHSEVI